MGNKNSLGDRIKSNYENRQRYYLTRRIPVICRVDGRAFGTLTKNFDKPFDNVLINSMVYAADKTAFDNGTQGFVAAYIQSDECSFLFRDNQSLESCAWFDYNKSKIETITASSYTYWFNDYLRKHWKKQSKCPHGLFDARSFNIPKEEVVNYFLWRAKDWERNSLNMYTSSFYSQKELEGKNNWDRHEMLHKKGKNWTRDLTQRQKNGTMILSNGEITSDFLPAYESLSCLLDVLLQ